MWLLALLGTLTIVYSWWSKSGTAILITISEKEAVPMHIGNKLVVAWASLLTTLWHNCDVIPEGHTCGTRAQAAINT